VRDKLEAEVGAQRLSESSPDRVGLLPKAVLRPVEKVWGYPEDDDVAVDLKRLRLLHSAPDWNRECFERAGPRDDDVVNVDGSGAFGERVGRRRLVSSLRSM
jgi:hypothetical protein